MVHQFNILPIIAKRKEHVEMFKGEKAKELRITLIVLNGL